MGVHLKNNAAAMVLQTHARRPNLDAGLGGELEGGVVVAGAQQVVDEDAVQAAATPVQGAILGRRAQLRQMRQPRPAPLQVAPPPPPPSPPAAPTQLEVNSRADTGDSGCPSRHSEGMCRLSALLLSSQLLTMGLASAGRPATLPHAALRLPLQERHTVPPRPRDEGAQQSCTHSLSTHR